MFLKLNSNFKWLLTATPFEQKVVNPKFICKFSKQK